MVKSKQTRTAIIDVETSTNNNGAWSDPTNKLCTVGIFLPPAGGEEGEYYEWKIEYDEAPYGQALEEIQTIISSVNLIVGFNVKFDLHWLSRYSIDFSHCRTYDCQLVYFIARHQSVPFPSLDDALRYFNLGEKDHRVEEEYWNRKIDTTYVPLKLLFEYQKKDVLLTYSLYQSLTTMIGNGGKSTMKALCTVVNYDLLGLMEMERNGLLYDVEKSHKLEKTLVDRLENVDKQLEAFVSGTWFNWNSNHHLSALLYGGTVVEVLRIPNGVYKSGPKIGQERYKLQEALHTFPGFVALVDRGEELATPGLYSTDQETLEGLNVKGDGKRLIKLLLERSEISKRLSTYCIGIRKLIDKYGWKVENGRAEIHGQLNQTNVVTGRLSSSKPNQQNFDGEIKYLFVSRWRMNDYAA